MIIRRTFLGVLIILAGSIIGALITRAGVYNRLIYLCLLLIITSWIWARVSIINVTVQRHSRGLRQQLGQVFEEQFAITNQFPFTKPWIEVEDASGLVSSGSTRILSWVKARTTRNYSGYTLLTRRGEYQLSPTNLYSGDPFGLFAFKKTVTTENTLMVLPFLVELKEFTFPSGRLPGGVALRRRTPEVEPPRAAGVREYGPGDPLNRIHWPTTARRERLMVKEFEQDPQADVWIFLDSHAEVHVNAEDGREMKDLSQVPLWWLNRNEYKLPVDTYEYAVSIAASIARYFARSAQVVGFASVSSKRVVLSSERGERQLNKILETLALIKPDGRMPIVSLVETQATLIHKGSTVIIITPSTHPSIMSGMAALLRRGMNPVIVLIDPSTFGRYYGIERTVSSLQSWKIPFLVVKEGDDLQKVLEQGVSDTITMFRKN
jgi:uncharacterized protein (DUF58 family)